MVRLLTILNYNEVIFYLKQWYAACAVKMFSMICTTESFGHQYYREKESKRGIIPLLFVLLSLHAYLTVVYLDFVLIVFFPLPTSAFFLRRLSSFISHQPFLALISHLFVSPSDVDPDLEPEPDPDPEVQNEGKRV